MTEFLLDENVLGLDRYLTGIKYKKIGDEGCPAKTDDSGEYAIAKNLLLQNCIKTHETRKKISRCIKLYVSANFKSFKINYRLD